jgi:hypothetical protein
MEGVAWSAQRIPTAVNLGFLHRSHYFSIQVAPQLTSRGWVDPVPDTLLLRKSVSAGNRTRSSGSVARNSDHLIRGWSTWQRCHVVNWAIIINSQQAEIIAFYFLKNVFSQSRQHNYSLLPYLCFLNSRLIFTSFKLRKTVEHTFPESMNFLQIWAENVDISYKKICPMIISNHLCLHAFNGQNIVVKIWVKK